MVNHVVIALGAPLLPDGRASRALHRRTLAACQLAQDIKATHLIFSGGVTRDGIDSSEAEMMSDIALEFNINQIKVIKEEEARNTLENAVFSRDILARIEDPEVHVVTDRAHIFRARFIFQAVGIKARFQATQGGGLAVAAYLYEFVALIWYAYRVSRGHHKINKSTKDGDI